MASQSSSAGPIYGFTARGAATERAVERRFLALPSAGRAREAHAFLSAEPHVAGSPRDRGLAEWTRDRWREYGLQEVQITEHDVLLPYGSDVSVEMGEGPAAWRASMREEPVPEDPATAIDVGPSYHAYSASGDVKAPVVYAGSGNPADYDWLAARGIGVAGRIVLVRYSVPYSYRGYKVWTAQQRGAAGILIYSDPEDDGSGKGPTYPRGPWGPDSRIQRGAIAYTFNVPGDPLTPGWPSLPGSRRIARSDAQTLPAIVSAPLSAKDARVILQALQGIEAPHEWQGGLPFPYRVGAGETIVRMRVRMDDAVRPIWTVTGKVIGNEHPDQLVIVGNHRDAWLFGGVDPASGSASLMELARSVGELARRGVRPARTIVFASWDAEEFALTSSTEWGEQHERELSSRAVAYLNVDSAASGTSFGALAVPSMNRVVTEAAAAVMDPETGRSIALAARGADLVNNRIGTGSDYTVFLNFLGVPIVDMSFTGPYGVYHSAYDTHAWVQKFGDPGFRYHVAMTQMWGVIALRIANAEILPIDYRPYAARVHEFLAEIQSSAPAGGRAALQPAREAADRFTRAAAGINARIDALLAGDSANAADATRINTALMSAERAMLATEGLPGRRWYRHLIYAPKPTYAAEVLPGVAEAIAARDPVRIADQVARLAAALDRVAAILQSAAE